VLPDTYQPDIVKGMDALLLGGNSPENKEWIHEVKAALAPLFDRVVVHEYAHWASAAPHIDLDHELRTVHRAAGSLGEYCIFAKSVGVVLSLKGISERSLRPAMCIFVGTPLVFVERHGHQMDVWLKALNMPTLFAQKAHDPAGSFPSVQHYIQTHLLTPHHQLVELPGDNHYYEPETVKELATQLVNQQRM
jgi:hypothetical protein